MKTFTSITFILALFLSTLPAFSQEQQPYQGSAELERVKSFAGRWHGQVDFGDGPVDITVEYRVVAGGSAVEERVFAHTPREMITIVLVHRGELKSMTNCKCEQVLVS